MFSARRVLEHSLISTATPEENRARLAELSGISNPLRRAGALSLHKLTSAHPALVARILNQPYGVCDLEYIGAGADSTVYRLSDDLVLKVDRESGKSTPEKRLSRALEKRQNNTAMSLYLGDLTLPEITTIGAHPHKGFRHIETVQTIQPFVEFVDPQIFNRANSVDTSINLPRLYEYCEEMPGRAEILSSFIVRSHALYDAEGLIPDTRGLANLVEVDGRGLTMIDGQPISRAHSEVQNIILEQLENLDTALV